MAEPKNTSGNSVSDLRNLPDRLQYKLTRFWQELRSNPRPAVQQNIAALRNIKRVTGWLQTLSFGGLLVVAWYAIQLSFHLHQRRIDGFADGFEPYLYGLAACGVVTAILSAICLWHVKLTNSSEEEQNNTHSLNQAGISDIALDSGKLSQSWIFRGIMLVAAVWLSIQAWQIDQTSRQFTIASLVSWLVSIPIWALVLQDNPLAALKRFGMSLYRTQQRLSQPVRIPVVLSTTTILLLLALAIGVWFRFREFNHNPPDMFLDHILTLSSAQEIANGNLYVFVELGGQESLYMYLLAGMNRFLGMPFDFTMLKVLSNLMSLTMILLALPMARILLPEDRRLGTLTGLIMAFLLAASFWQTTLSRDGLRTLSGILAVQVVIMLLARAMYSHKRSDFIWTGIALGISLYTYTHTRALPIVCVVGFLLMLVLQTRSRQTLWRNVLNMTALVVMSVALFVPSASYSMLNPVAYWGRVKDNFVGNNVNVSGPEGADAAVKAINNNIGRFGELFRNNILIFNWRGTTNRVYGTADASPELDPITGALFLIGLGFMAHRMFARRDPVDWLVPLAIVILILPAALGIALDAEPSMYRISGTMPLVYFVVALAPAMLLHIGMRLFPALARNPIVSFGAIALVGFLLLHSAAMNYYQYFVKNHLYQREGLPETNKAAEVIRSFSGYLGTQGNSFMVYVAGWLDGRMLAASLGDWSWQNTVGSPLKIEYLAERIRLNEGTANAFQPDRMMLVLVHRLDSETLDMLKTTFPNGSAIPIPTELYVNDFIAYIIPAPGCQWIIETTGFTPRACLATAAR